MSDMNHNSNCRYAADIVSYLYDEIETGERAIFEKHLKSCSNCADELADFSFARFAVKDWRDQEFSHLVTPSFEIPFDVKQSNERAATHAASLFGNLQRIFSFRPIWAMSAAALIVLIGLVFTANNLFQPDLTAKNDGADSANVSLSPVEKNVKQTVENFSADSENISSAEPTMPEIRNAIPEKSQPATKIRRVEARRNAVVKVTDREPKSRNEIKAAENLAASDVKNFDKQPEKDAAPINRQIPTLNSFEDDDDNTLRLAELFEDIDTRK